MTVEHIRSYMAALLEALDWLHSNGVREHEDIFFNRAIPFHTYVTASLMALSPRFLFQIVHRDIKPANFLHAFPDNEYMLVDFNLAIHVDDLQASIDRKITSSVKKHKQEIKIKTKSKSQVHPTPSIPVPVPAPFHPANPRGLSKTERVKYQLSNTLSRELEKIKQKGERMA